MENTLIELENILFTTLKSTEETVNFLYKYNYLEAGINVQDKICNKLVKAYEHIGKIIFKKRNRRIINYFTIEADVENVLKYLKEALNILYIRYDLKLAKKIKNVLIDIKNTNQIMDIFDEDIIDKIDEYIERTEFINYAKESEEYPKLERLFEIENEILKDFKNFSVVNSTKTDFIKLISLLKNLEEELYKMGGFNDEYLKSSYISYFKENLGKKLSLIQLEISLHYFLSGKVTE